MKHTAGVPRFAINSSAHGESSTRLHNEVDPAKRSASVPPGGKPSTLVTGPAYGERLTAQSRDPQLTQHFTPGVEHQFPVHHPNVTRQQIETTLGLARVQNVLNDRIPPKPLVSDPDLSGLDLDALLSSSYSGREPMHPAGESLQGCCPAGGSGSSLATATTFVQEKRRTVFSKQRRQQRHSYPDDVAASWLYCGRTFFDLGGVSGIPAQSLTVRSTAGGSHAKMNGVFRCGNTWVCPSCSMFLAQGRATQVRALLDLAEEQGLQVGFMTLTMRHHAQDELMHLWKGLREAFRIVRSRKAIGGDSRTGKGGVIDETGVIGNINVCEVKIGENGWHPHLHVLWFFDPSKASMKFESVEDRVQFFGAAFFAKWDGAIKSAVKAKSFTYREDVKHPEKWGATKNGFDVRAVKSADIHSYVTKVGAAAGDMSLEMTSAFNKTEKTEKVQFKHGSPVFKHSITPMQLSELIDSDDRDLKGWAWARWCEYIKASKSKRQLLIAPALKIWALSHGLDISDLDKEENDQEDVEAGEDEFFGDKSAPTVLAAFDADVWKAVAWMDKDYQLFEVVENAWTMTGGDVVETMKHLHDELEYLSSTPLFQRRFRDRRLEVVSDPDGGFLRVILRGGDRSRDPLLEPDPVFYSVP